MLVVEQQETSEEENSGEDNSDEDTGTDASADENSKDENSEEENDTMGIIPVEAIEVFSANSTDWDTRNDCGASLQTMASPT